MLIDLHAHTSGISTCCHISAPEVVEITKNIEIDGIVLTNHYKKEYVVNGEIKSFVEAYIKEYHYTKKCAEDIGLKCFFGIELTMVNYPGVDMLIYGVGEDFLRFYPELYDLSQEELYRIVKKENGILIQAHPFRNGTTVLNADFLDGIEINCHPLYNNSYSQEIFNNANKNNLAVTCGGDFHADTYRPKCGMYLPDDIADGYELSEYIKNAKKVSLHIHEPNSTISKKIDYYREI